jgi:hypothetical protein
VARVRFRAASVPPFLGHHPEHRSGVVGEGSEGCGGEPRRAGGHALGPVPGIRLRRSRSGPDPQIVHDGVWQWLESRVFHFPENGRNMAADSQASLRPVDVVVALRLTLCPEDRYESLAHALGIGVSAAHRSVKHWRRRGWFCRIAGPAAGSRCSSSWSTASGMPSTR